MKLIGAGFGRTGTLSLKVALEQLGIGPSYHMAELFRRPERAPLWQAAAEGKPVDWQEIFAGYDATVDWPGAAFYGQILQSYHEARVILTVRDAETWYRSVVSTIHRPHRPRPDEELDPVSRANRAIIWRGIFGGDFADRSRAIAAYRRHIEEVRDTVPADRLLVYDVRDGWDPLCRFLELPVPTNVSFPHLNDRRTFRHRV